MAAVTDTSIWLNQEVSVSKRTHISVSKPAVQRAFDDFSTLCTPRSVREQDRRNDCSAPHISISGAPLASPRWRKHDSVTVRLQGSSVGDFSVVQACGRVTDSVSAPARYVGASRRRAVRALGRHFRPDPLHRARCYLVATGRT
jgi:hypothetical protein